MKTEVASREDFIQNNLGLVHACAGRFRGRGIEYDDLYSAGCLGLVKAYDGFDWNRGVCFSTYAVPLILGEVKKLFRDGGTVKVSRSLKETSMKAAAVREKMLKRDGVEPTVSQIAEKLGISPEQVALAIKAGLPALSLTPSAEDDDRSVVDIPVEGQEEKLAEKLSLRSELAQLSEKDRELIALRFYKGMTQCQAAQVLGTTQVQISRRERKLLGQLRERLA